VQNAKVKMRGKDTMACGHTAILQFEIYNLHFALVAAEGSAMKSLMSEHGHLSHNRCIVLGKYDEWIE
jgi:hypothetical protein